MIRDVVEKDLRERERERERERDELDIFLAENVVRDAPDSGFAESSSVVEIDSALVRLPASTNSGESGGDDLSETERNLRGNEPRRHRTETTSGDERDRAASQALESSGVLTDEGLLQGLNTPRGLSRVLEGSEPPSGGSANGGGPSPRTDVESTAGLRGLACQQRGRAPRHTASSSWLGNVRNQVRVQGGMLRRHYVHRRDMFSPRSVRPSTGEYGFGSAIAQLQDKVRGHRAL